jgi:hypothetical protein
MGEAGLFTCAHNGRFVWCSPRSAGRKNASWGNQLRLIEIGRYALPASAAQGMRGLAGTAF